MDAYYKEDWTDEDKELFDLMVKEEMEKLKNQSSTKSNHIIEKESTNYEQPYEPPYGRIDKKSIQLKGFEQALPKDDRQTNNNNNINKNSNRVNSADNNNNSGFVSKLGEYETSKNNIDSRKARQMEYANLLQQQISQGYDSNNNLDGRRSDSRIRRSNPNSYENPISKGTGFVIGADPNVQKQIERNKRLEYSKLLEEQIEYQKSSPSKSYIGTRSIQNDNDYRQDSNSWSRNEQSYEQSLPRRSPSPITTGIGGQNMSLDEKKNRQLKYAEDLRRDAQVKSIASSGRREQNNGIFNTNNTNQSANLANSSINSQYQNDNQRKRDNQQDYYRQISEAAEQPRITSNRTNISSRDNEELPGGGFLSIGENKQQSAQRYPSRSVRSIEEQEAAIKRKDLQRDYFNKLQEDSENIGSVINTNTNSYRRNSSARSGLIIGDDNINVDIRKKKQQDYAEALARDASRKPIDMNSLERKPSRLRSNGSSNESYQSNQYNNDYQSNSNPYNNSPQNYHGRGKSTGGGISNIVFG